MRSRLIRILVPLALLAAVLIPVFTLFQDGKYMYYAIRSPELWKELVEIGILLALTFGSLFLLKDIKKIIAVLAFLVLSFCYLHSVFLPMAVSLLFFLGLIACGNFVTGCSIVIIGICLLSIFGLGQMNHIRIWTAVFSIVSILLFFIRRKGEHRYLNRLQWNPEGYEKAILALLIIIFLIQAGRMNLTLDYDSMWYGFRSDRVLSIGSGIYEDAGMVGVVYTYSKGFEILTLALSGLKSHSYLLFFNLWVMILGWYKIYKLARCFVKKKYAWFAVLITAFIPAITNMSVSAKPDMITWVLQIILLESFFSGGLLEALPSYLLSLAMKPTAIIFSTALFGMMLISTLIEKKPLHKGKGWILSMCVSVAALAGTWYRTYKLTGLLFTSVFSGVLVLLGFRLKYPFNTSSVPQNYLYESPLPMLLRRLFRILLSPDGKDMSHVLIAWSGTIIFVMLVFIILKRPKLHFEAKMIFIPFIIVNIISLMMLYQVDGNYFMTVYSVITIMFICALEEYADNCSVFSARTAYGIGVLMLVSQLLLMCMTNWASAIGFSEIKLNKGYYNHLRDERQMLSGYAGGEDIWSILSSDKNIRVIAFGEHPYCLQFPCVVQSYNDITEPWGNGEIVESSDAFEQYMRFAKIDYVYAQTDHLDMENRQWSKELLNEMIADGSLVYAAGADNILYRVVYE